MAETSSNSKPQQSTTTFKDKYTYEERLNEARKKKENNPRLLPVIVEKHNRSKLPQMEKSNIKSKLKLDKTEALYFFTARKKIDRPNLLVREIYEQNKDEDEFLYITYAELETFGGISDRK